MASVTEELRATRKCFTYIDEAAVTGTCGYDRVKLQLRFLWTSFKQI